VIEVSPEAAKLTPIVEETGVHHKRPALNQVRDADSAAHDWYRFVLSFPPHLVQDYLQKFGLTQQQQVLDPFSGTGTTVVECKKLGISGFGTEANPMAWFAGSVKLNWTPDPDTLLAIASRIAEATEKMLKRKPATLQTLPEESEKIILTNSISPMPLHKTLVLLDKIKRHGDKAYNPHFRLAFAKAVVGSISNLHFGPEVGVGKPKDDAPVVEAWMKEVTSIAQDLRYLQTLEQAPATIYQADARQLVQVIQPHSIDAVFTSPPYPNEKDYTRTTRLESVLLGFIRNKTELRALKQGLIRSNTRNVYKADTDDLWVGNHLKIQQIAEAIESRRIELGKTSGFERMYARTTKLYFGGMARHLADLRHVLRPGAYLGYVVGDQASYLRIMIRTGQLLAEIAEDLGYEVVSIDLFRTRLATATREQLREEVVVLRWSGKMPTAESRYAKKSLA
jgi:16S rRNA G966 N2-methylase RsmD